MARRLAGATAKAVPLSGAQRGERARGAASSLELFGALRAAASAQFPCGFSSSERVWRALDEWPCGESSSFVESGALSCARDSFGSFPIRTCHG